MADLAKVPVSVRVSYDVLRDWMHLPSDVDLLGVIGAHDPGGVITINVETPVHHIKGANLSAQYERTDDGVEFKGFA